MPYRVRLRRGRTNTAVAADLGVNQITVSKWRHRFAADRL
jgi:transposase-like protein